MGKRDERRRVRQQAVLTAALEILTEEGVAGVTIAAVARRINASVGGLYRYYPTKNAIFEALQIHALDAFKRFLSIRLAAHRISPARRVALGIRAHTGRRASLERRGSAQGGLGGD